MDDWMPAGMFCLAHKHFLKIQMTEDERLSGDIPHKTGLQAHLEESEDRTACSRTAHGRAGWRWAKAAALLPKGMGGPVPPCLSLHWPGARGWPLLVHLSHSFTSLLWSLNVTVCIFCSRSIKFYSWVSSDHQKAAVLDHTVLAHCPMSSTEYYIGTMSSHVTAINCFHWCCLIRYHSIF